MKNAEVKQSKVYVDISRTRSHGQREGLGSDHLENETTTVTNSTGCSRRGMGAPLNTLTSGMSLRSRIPTSTVCKKTSMENTHKQSPRAGMGKARAGRCQACQHEGHAHLARASKEQIRAHEGLCQRWALSTLGFVNVNCVVGCVCGTCTLHRTNHEQVDCVWIIWGMVFYHRLAAAARQPSACHSVA